VLAGIGGLIGLAAAGGALTWVTRSFSSYFVLPLLTYRGHQKFIESLCWSPDGTRIVSVGDEFTDSFLIWEAATGKTLSTAPAMHEGRAISATWSPNGRWIAVEYLGHGAAVWDMANATVLAMYPDIIGLVTGWSPDSTRLIATQDGVIWEVATGRQLVTWQQRYFSTYCAAWSPDGSRIASGGDLLEDASSPLALLAQVVIWDAATGQSLVTYDGHAQEEGTVFRLAWSPDSTRIASVTETIVHVWEAASGRTLVLYRGHTGVVAGLAWSPDGRRLASASIDGTVQIWNPVNGEGLFTYHGHNMDGNSNGPGVTTAAWSPDGKVIASGDNRGTIQIWRPE
jgi:WD40 repeat protein